MNRFVLISIAAAHVATIVATGNSDYYHYNETIDYSSTTDSSVPEKYYIRKPKWCFRWEKETNQTDSYHSYKYYTEKFEWEMSTLRWSHFCYNMCQIKYHNENPNYTWKKGINKFSCYHPKEFIKIYGQGAKVPPSVTATRTSSLFRKHVTSTSTTPKTPKLAATANTVACTNYECDFTSSTGPVPNQGQCGACWAFAASQQIGCYSCLKKKQCNVWASYQQFVDCIAGSNCNGGFMTDAYNYCHSNSGAYTTTAYTYNGVQGTCNTALNTPKVAFVQTSGIMADSDDSTMPCKICQYVRANGCVSIGIFADVTLQQYESGVYSCPPGVATDVTHAVTIVGCTTVNGYIIYICKNSWGPSWGDKGYFKLNSSLVNAADCNAHWYPCWATT